MAHKYYKYLTILLIIIFDYFGIWLLDYRIDFSCVYIPQVHYFVSF